MEIDDEFSIVAASALRGGEILGAPDHLDRDLQLELALELIAALAAERRELARGIPGGRGGLMDVIEQLARGDAPGPSRAERRREAAERRRRGELSAVAYLRLLVWIQLRSRAHAREQALRRVRATLKEIRNRDAVLDRIRRLADDGDLDRAHVLGRALLPDHRERRDFLSVLREVEGRRGALSAALAVGRALEATGEDHGIALRKLEGRIREASGWVPTIPGDREPVEPADDATVLHLVKESRPYLSNGFTSRSHRNVLAEQAAGLRPVVLTELGFPVVPDGEPVPAVGVVDGIEHRRLPYATPIKDVPVDVWLQEFAQAAYDVVREVRPSVIHVSSGRRGYETALVGLALAEKTGLPLVYEVRSFFETTWTADLARGERGEIFLRRLATEQMVLARADQVITLGEAMREELVRRGADPARIHVVPNGVDLDAFPPDPRPADLARGLGIDDRPTFGYVSNLDHPREAQETLVRATAELVRRGRDVRCVLVGGGPRSDLIRSLAIELGVGEHVVLTGPVDHGDVARYYALIDVFVVPRTDERAARYVTPLKPFEAMAVGRPVVASDLPALREITDPPHRGLVFPPDDHVALANVVQGLLDDPARAAQLGSAGRAWVEQERQWSMNGERYRAVFAAAWESAAARSETRARSV